MNVFFFLQKRDVRTTFDISDGVKQQSLAHPWVFVLC